MFASSAEITEIENHIKAILNASQTWGGAVNNRVRLPEAITRSRKLGTMEVLRAISKNPQHGAWMQLAAYIDVDHNSPLPIHDGAHGIPQIIPFTDAPEMTGKPADADDIDSWRADGNGLFTRVLGKIVAHDGVDFMGMPSQYAGFYDVTHGVIKFTGKTCKIPLINLTDAMCDTKLPISLADTVIKLAPLYNLREGDNLVGIAATLVAEGKKDLARIEGGAMTVPPFSDVVAVQEKK